MRRHATLVELAPPTAASAPRYPWRSRLALYRTDAIGAPDAGQIRLAVRRARRRRVQVRFSVGRARRSGKRQRQPLRDNGIARGAGQDERKIAPRQADVVEEPLIRLLGAAPRVSDQQGGATVRRTGLMRRTMVKYGALLEHVNQQSAPSFIRGRSDAARLMLQAALLLHKRTTVWKPIVLHEDKPRCPFLSLASATWLT